MPKATIGEVLNEASFNLEGRGIAKRPFLADMGEILLPVVGVNENFKEYIQFAASKTIAGAPAGAAFQTPPVGRSLIEVWHGLWVRHTDGGAGNVVFTLTQFFGGTPGSAGKRGEIRVQSIDDQLPILGMGPMDPTFPNFTTQYPLILNEGGSIQLSTAVALALGTVISVNGFGWRMAGPPKDATDISTEISVV